MRIGRTFGMVGPHRENSSSLNIARSFVKKLISV